MHSRILVGLLFTTFAYTLSKAAPTVQDASPVLHLTEDQVKQFKHADPNQLEPDIAFPKNVESLYAGSDAPVDDSLVGGVEANALVDTNDAAADEEVIQEDSIEEEEEEEGVIQEDSSEEVEQEDAVQEDEYVYEEDEAVAPAEEDYQA